MTNLDTSTSFNVPDSITTLQFKLRSESEKAQLQLVSDLIALDEAGYLVLMNFLKERQATGTLGRVDAKIYQALYSTQEVTVLDFLHQHFPTGTIVLRSDRGINYAPLQQLLAQQNFEEADRVTLQKMCEAAGDDAAQRKWLYFTEVEGFPVTDLQTIDALWIAHSDGRFGFSIQREIWLSLSKNWEKLWDKIGWKSGNNWTRYPGEFVWSLEAPRGHLPLTNQLRGVRVMASLMAHSAWVKEKT
ncbi:GUN4 domain-containing protein [Myxacorys almedinensis]|uniref:GUN4-like domain-containing protein n=1 Tax=Myxacorys almedinensis A TaxID=2690445 RepID=A0A8J7Z156_9CYAN|nr:GUN4 domain-containing protein [Myxacorys almedinensis]NDJ17769.1 hypothetical protein [Myxacorys almedinensis A]